MLSTITAITAITDFSVDTNKLSLSVKHPIPGATLRFIEYNKKPLIIFGQSALKSNSAKYIFESIKTYLNKNNKISNEWNSLNVISDNASTVG